MKPGPTCESIVARWSDSNPDERERVKEPCDLPAHWRVRATDTGVGIRVCHRHARWWRSRRTDHLRALFDFEVVADPLADPQPETAE